MKKKYRKKWFATTLRVSGEGWSESQLLHRYHYVYTPGHDDVDDDDDNSSNSGNGSKTTSFLLVYFSPSFHLLPRTKSLYTLNILPKHFSKRTQFFFFHFAVLLLTEAIRTLCVRISAFYISAWIFCSPVTFVYQPNDHLCTFSIFLMRFFTSFFSAVLFGCRFAHTMRALNFFPFVFSLLLFYPFACFLLFLFAFFFKRSRSMQC